MGLDSEHWKKADASTEAKTDYANPLDWAGKNIVNPIWNSLCAEPASAIVNAINFASQKTFNTDILAKVELAEVGQEQPGSAGSYVQQIAGGLACVLPYAKAGKLAGFGMRGLSRAAKTEKWFATGAKIAGNEKVAQVVGAAVYDGLKNTRGEETHISNAMGGAASFTAYELLNPRLKGIAKLGLGQGKLGVLTRMGAHTAGLFGIGAAGSIAHEEVSTFTRTGQFVDLNKAAENSVQGGVMNILLPATQHALGKTVDRVNQKIGRGTPMDRARQELPENIQESPTVKQFIDDNPLVRVQRIDGKDCYVDHDRHIVYYGKEAPVSEFIHELSHLMNERSPQQKALYKAVDVLDKQGKTAEADAAYISARAASEIRAREIGDQVARECGLPSEAKTWTVEAVCAEKLDGQTDGRTYLDHWMQERRQLQTAGKSTRAEIDYSVLAGTKPAEMSFDDRLSKLKETYKASGGIFPVKADAHANIVNQVHQTIENSGTYSPQHKESLHKLLNIFVDTLSDTGNLYAVAAKYRNENKRFDGVYDALVENGPAQALWEVSKSTLKGSRKETLLLDMAIATNGKIGDFISSPEAVQKILETIDVKQMREKREAYLKAGLLNWDVSRSFEPKRAGKILDSLGAGSDSKQYQKAFDVLREIMPIENADAMTEKQFQDTVNRIVGNEDKGGASSENWRRVLQSVTPERIANLPEGICLQLVDRIGGLKEGTRQEIRQTTIDEIVYGPVDGLVERVIGSGIERIRNLSDKHFIDGQNAEKIREIMKHTFEYVAKLPDVQRREAQFEVLRGLVKEGVLQKVNCTNEELQLLVSSLDKCSNRMRSLPHSEQADIIIDMIREFSLRNEMHDAGLMDKTVVNAINAIDPETVPVIAAKASDVVLVMREVLKDSEKEAWKKNGLTEKKCNWIFDEISTVVGRSLRRPLASDSLIDSVFCTFSEPERVRLKEALVERGDYLSVDRMFAQFQELAGSLREELKNSQERQGINEPADTYIYAKHEPGRRDVQAINVLCRGESTVGHALSHLFRKVTGISVNIEVIGKDGKAPEGKWITFEPTDFIPSPNKTDGHPGEIDQHIANLRKFGDGINFLDLYRGEALGIDKNHDIDHLYRKLESILHPGMSTVDLEKRVYERYCSQNDHTRLADNEIESLKDALSPYDAINMDVRTIQALMFLRDKQRARTNSLLPQDAIKYVNRYTSQITYSRMFEQSREAMKRLKDAFGEKDTNKFLFVTDIDNGGSTHLTTYLFRLANGLEAADHLFVSKKEAQEAVENARRNGQTEPIIVYVDDYTYTGTQISNFHAKDMIGLGSRTAALVLGAFEHGREAVTKSMKDQEGERKFVVGDQYDTIEQILKKGVGRFFDGRFAMPNSYCSTLVVPHLQDLLNKPLQPEASKIMVESTIESIGKVLSAIGGSEWDKSNKKWEQLRKKAKKENGDAPVKKHVTGLILPHFVPNNAPELFDKLFVGYFGYARASSSKVFAKPYLEIKPAVEPKAADENNSDAVKAIKKRTPKAKKAVTEAALQNFDGAEVKKKVGSSKGSDKGAELVTEGLYRKGAIRSDAAMAEMEELGIKSIAPAPVARPVHRLTPDLGNKWKADRARVSSVKEKDSVKQSDEELLNNALSDGLAKLEPAQERAEKLDWRKQIEKAEGVALIPGVKVQRLTPEEARSKHNFIVRDNQIIIYRKETGLKVTLERGQLAKNLGYARLFTEAKRNCFMGITKLPESAEYIFERIAKVVGRS